MYGQIITACGYNKLITPGIYDSVPNVDFDEEIGLYFQIIKTDAFGNKYFDILTYDTLEKLKIDPGEFLENISSNLEKDWGIGHISYKKFYNVTDYKNSGIVDRKNSIIVGYKDLTKYGSGILLYKNIFDKLYDIVKENYYLCPASIHTFLILRASEFDETYARSLANRQSVGAWHAGRSIFDILSTRAYKYTRDGRKIERLPDIHDNAKKKQKIQP